MSATKKVKPTKASLARQIVELKAQLASTYHFADATIGKAENLMSSGVVVTLTALGGNEITVPFVIRDGFSRATVDALRADIRRSYELATLFKPKGLSD